jgi:hypothetical protein
VVKIDQIAMSLMHWYRVQVLTSILINSLNGSQPVKGFIFLSCAHCVHVSGSIILLKLSRSATCHLLVRSQEI